MPKKGYKWPEEVKRARSLAYTGRKMPKGTGARISAALLGHICTEETREKYVTQTSKWWLSVVASVSANIPNWEF